MKISLLERKAHNIYIHMFPVSFQKKISLISATILVLHLYTAMFAHALWYCMCTATLLFAYVQYYLCAYSAICVCTVLFTCVQCYLFVYRMQFFLRFDFCAGIVVCVGAVLFIEYILNHFDLIFFDRRPFIMGGNFLACIYVFIFWT